MIRAVRPTRAAVRAACALLLAASAIGCGGRFDPAEPFSSTPITPTGPPIGIDSQLDLPHPLFPGIDNLLAGDGEVWISWVAPNDADGVTPPDEMIYHLFLAAEPGTFDYTTPDLITAPGETMVHLTGLPNGVAFHAVVRAVDGDGNSDPNTAEWSALPNPVRYVDAAAPPGGNGLTPATAFNNAAIAQITALGIPGVNFWVAEGDYTTTSDVWNFMFPGRSVYGGFADTFDPLTRDPENRITRFQPDSITSPLVTLLNPVTPPGSVVVVPGSMQVVDGLRLESFEVSQGIGQPPLYPAFSGVRIQDTIARVSNCSMLNLSSKGIDMTGDFDGSGLPITVTVRNCSIDNIDGEGIAIDGHTPTVIIDNVTIKNVANEGIEAQWINADSNTSARIEITRCTIDTTGALDEGIDLDFDEEDPTNPGGSIGARIRALIRNNTIINAGVAGVNLDLDFENSDGLDFRGRIEDNVIRDCKGHGVNLDGDARGSFRVARNVISGNGGAGIHATGALGGPYTRILHNRIIGNEIGGIFAEGAITGEVRHSLFQGNRGPAVTIDRAVLTVANSIFIDNAPGSNPTSIDHCIFFGEPAPANATNATVADPMLESTPLFLTVATAPAGGGLIPLATSAGIFVDDTIELRDDGIVRTVTAVAPTSITVDPPTAVEAGDLVAAWGDSDTVREAEGLLVGSPAINGGNLLESDRDGTVADIGPIGGDTPGNIGVETGVPEESAALELVAVDPSPAEVQTGSTWVFTFNRDLVPDVTQMVSVRRGASDLTASALLTVGERTITIDLASVPFAPGETIQVSLDPGDFVVPGDDDLVQPAVIEFPSVIGASLADLDAIAPDVNGTTATAQAITALPTVVDGQIGFPGDVDVYSVSLLAGETIRPELYMRQIESLLQGRITLFAESGATISTGVSDPVFFFDPILPAFTTDIDQTVTIRVETSNALDPLATIGAYRLTVR